MPNNAVISPPAPITQPTSIPHPASSAEPASPPPEPRRHSPRYFPVPPSGPGDHSSTALATHMSRRILEVLAGRQALGTLRSHLSGPVALALAGGLCKKAGGPDYRLRSVHACLTTTSTVEACALIETANRVRALVLRFERRDSRWLCTLLAPL